MGGQKSSETAFAIIQAVEGEGTISVKFFDGYNQAGIPLDWWVPVHDERFRRLLRGPCDLGQCPHGKIVGTDCGGCRGIANASDLTIILFKNKLRVAGDDWTKVSCCHPGSVYRRGCSCVTRGLTAPYRKLEKLYKEIEQQRDETHNQYIDSMELSDADAEKYSGRIKNREREGYGICDVFESKRHSDIREKLGKRKPKTSEALRNDSKRAGKFFIDSYESIANRFEKGILAFQRFCKKRWGKKNMEVKDNAEVDTSILSQSGAAAGAPPKSMGEVYRGRCEDETCAINEQSLDGDGAATGACRCGQPWFEVPYQALERYIRRFTDVGKPPAHHEEDKSPRSVEPSVTDPIAANDLKLIPTGTI